MLNEITYKFRHILILSLFALSFLGARQFAAFAHSSTVGIHTIVIDPGHGGIDPGKIGINNALEKDINLSIALKLQSFFEKKGFNVIMTRTTDADLSSKTSDNHKNEDLNNRVSIMADSNADIVISIHQNGFSDGSAVGPETFYYENSPDGKALAEAIQWQLDNTLLLPNSRGITPSSSYFILKKSPTPTVIVECGFLSNYNEAELLITDEYQYKLARSIFVGACSFLED